MNNPWKSWLNMSSALLDVLLCGLMQAGRLPPSQQDKGGFYLKETSSLGLNRCLRPKKMPKKKTNKRAKQLINCMKLHFALKHDRKRKEQARHSTLLHTVSGFLTFPSSRCVSQSCLFNKHAVQFLSLLLLLWFLNQLKCLIANSFP